MSSSLQPLPDLSPQDETAASLRTTLRDTPLLPAPANVDDLLIRLGSDEAPLSSGTLASGALAALISDARVPDLEPLSPDLFGYEESDLESFFAPIALAANTNIATAAPPSSRFRPAWRHLLRAALPIGVGLLAWLLIGPAMRTASTLLPNPSKPDTPAIAVPELAATALAPPSDLDGSGAPAMIVPPVIAEIPVALPPDETTVLSAPAGLSASLPPIIPDQADSSSETSATGDLPTNAEGEEQEGEKVPPPSDRPARSESVPFAGRWAVSAKACTPAMRRQGFLTADIDAERGRAGSTTCTFKRMERRKGNAWAIAAVCSNGQTSWKSNIRLTLNRGRLIWKSQRGSVTYVRCRNS